MTGEQAGAPVSAGGDDDAVTDPIGLIVRLVTAVEHGLTEQQITEVVTAVAGRRAARRSLARSLQENPQALVTGRPPASRATVRLLLALRAAGAVDVSAPRCGGCGRDLRSVRRTAGGDWSCGSCADEARTTTCAGCGEQRVPATRDRHGRARCTNCPDSDGDPIGALITLVTALDPALGEQTIAAVLTQATVQPAGQRRLAWAVLARPDLLTGSAADAPTPAVLRFVDALAAAGVAGVVRPACPRCGTVKALSKLLAGQRVCRNCFARAAAVACARCGAVREPAARDDDGDPLCSNCLVKAPANQENCAGCRRRARVTVRLPDGPRCANCRPRQTAVCSICGQTGPCEISRATGQPWCARCQKCWAPCSGCATVAPVRGGTRQRPLCAWCVNPDPDFWGRCPVCAQTWQLSPAPCQRCALAAKSHNLLAGPAGTIRNDLAPLHHALLAVERPDSAMVWLGRPKVRDLLSALGGDSRRLTHTHLDELPASKTLTHLRAVLVAAGALPARDEQLASLERWIGVTLAVRTDPGERHLLRGYAIWHHLRRLRRRLGTATVTYPQARNLRSHVTAAARFLDWLSTENLTLATCAQPDLDRWTTSDQAQYWGETGYFVRWAVSHRHATGLTFGAVRWEGPRGPHDGEQRWVDAHRLLHDDTLATSDRVAGLLLLLYAQGLADITRLTTDAVRDDGEQVRLLLGTTPVLLPEPLASLVRDLVATRHGRANIGRPGVTPWLFPGARPGQPISNYGLGTRLRNIGLQPLQARSTALFTLAAELPAAILARMLGIHIQVAVQWQRASAGDWMTYAADVSRRRSKP
jgi:hypothetical protein